MCFKYEDVNYNFVQTSTLRLLSNRSIYLNVFFVFLLMLYDRTLVWTSGVTLLVLHFWCYTSGITFLVLHFWCYTSGRMWCSCIFIFATYSTLYLRSFSYAYAALYTHTHTHYIYLYMLFWGKTPIYLVSKF